VLEIHHEVMSIGRTFARPITTGEARQKSSENPVDRSNRECPNGGFEDATVVWDQVHVVFKKTDELE